MTRGPTRSAGKGAVPAPAAEAQAATAVEAAGIKGRSAAGTVPDAVPLTAEALAPLGLIVPGQLLVEGLARARGLDPDAPRGLSKVTQTDRG